MHHLVSWSGGKDSTAAVILLHENYHDIVKPGDKVTILFAEVMYDLERNISGHNPDVIKFIYNTAEVFRTWGFDVEIIRGKKDYLHLFHHIIADNERTKHPEHRGRPHGFMLPRRCDVKRDCKIIPIKKWKKRNLADDYIDYIGIAVDEPKRLLSLNEGQVSLLAKYGLTENDARALCEKYDMLSPQYKLNDKKQKRDGCWFCPYSKLCEFEKVKNEYPDIWKEFVALEDTPNIVYDKWAFYNGTLSLKDIDKLI